MKKSWLTPWERNQRGEEEEAPGASASAGGHSSGSWCNRGLRLATFITDLTISVTAAKTQKVGELRGARHDSGAEMEGWEWSWYEWRTVKQRSWTGSRLFQDFVVHKARRVTFRRETATTTVLPCHVTSCEPATWGKTVLLFAFMCVAATAVEFILFIHLSVVCFVVLFPAVIVSHCISVAKRNLLHPPSYPLLLFIAVGLFFTFNCYVLFSEATQRKASVHAKSTQWNVYRHLTCTLFYFFIYIHFAQVLLLQYNIIVFFSSLLNGRYQSLG